MKKFKKKSNKKKDKELEKKVTSSKKKKDSKKKESKKKKAKTAVKAKTTKTPKKKVVAKPAVKKTTKASKPVAKKTKTTAAKKTTAKKTVSKATAKPKKKVSSTRTTKPKTRTQSTKSTTAAKPRASKSTTAKSTRAKSTRKTTVAKKTTKRIVKAKTPKPINKVQALKNEVWKKIKLPHPAITSEYFVSNMGRLKNKNKATKSEMLLKGYFSKPRGYQMLNLKLANGKRASYYVHKLVAEFFVSKNRRREQLFATHKDGVRSNNKASNITWMNQKELTAHHVGLGTYTNNRPYTLGSHVVMTEAKVRRLKKDLMKGKLTRTKMAEKYGITMTQIKRIDRGENWGHVTID